MGAVDSFWKPYIYEKLLQICPPVLTWRERRWLLRKYAETLACADNQKIPRHPDAGKIVDGYQIMHNGLKIIPDCYSSLINRGMLTNLFEKNQGVHEPSEEYAFQVILDTMPEKATIVELGAWWSFYSMWFCSKVKTPSAYMVEPEVDRLEFGRKNFDINGLKGKFFNYFLGKKSGTWMETKRSLIRGTYEVETDARVICLDDFIAENKIDFIDILHADIQGAEVDLLIGAEKALTARKVRYFVLSTHSKDLHENCIRILTKQNYKILCEADLTEAMHVDGFLVARAAEMPGPETIQIDKLKHSS